MQNRKPNFHSQHCRSVRTARNRFERLKARNARPRTIKRAGRLLEARSAVAEARHERFQEALKVVTDLVNDHFGDVE